ncbi:MAG: EVE domain-containing protein [Saprospiraceae bacterium]|nr:EVE domain-containing protein [Saprospiraceae bacterium]
MQYWLVKSEPDTYSFEKLVAEKTAIWDGVRNYQARNNLRAMKQGDTVLFYHSNIGLVVVGIATVIEEFFPDATAEKGDWSAIRLAPVKPIEMPVPLTLIKSMPELAEIGLVKNPRLSVMPLSKQAFNLILKLGNTKL